MADSIARWEPFATTLSLRDAMDRLFEDSVVAPRALGNRAVTGRANSLPIDAYETPDEVVVNMIAPGIKSEDVDLQFQDGRLIIDVAMPEPKLENVIWHYREIGYGQVNRELALPYPINLDKVEAELKNGYLTLRLPKADTAKPKKIHIQNR